MSKNSDHIRLRRGVWYYYRRVPKEYADIDSRKFVRKSLKTESQDVARRRAEVINAAQEERWETLFTVGNSEDAKKKYDAAVRLARTLGFQYQTAAKLADDELANVVARMKAIAEHGIENKPVVAALAGGVDKPRIRLSEGFNTFVELNQDRLKRKTDAEVRRWKNPRLKALKNFIALHGDLYFDQVDRDMALEFRRWWVAKILEEDLTNNAANKDLSALSKMFRDISDAMRLGIQNPFSELRLSEADEASTKTSFDPQYAKGLVAGDALKGMGDELRHLLMAMPNSGCGFKELTGLDPEAGDIRLDAPIPFIHIRRNRFRGLKNKHRDREIPLVGTTLTAFTAYPSGFISYQGRNDSASTAANKFMRENKLLPSSDHGVNSFRHTFEDMLTAVETPEKVHASLMGHKYIRERYGKPPPLELKKQYLDLIAF